MNSNVFYFARNEVKTIQSIINYIFVFVKIIKTNFDENISFRVTVCCFNLLPENELSCDLNTS
jgi:hypothetical protein